MKDLGETRDAIRKIDEQMALLFVQRMEAVRDIARYKHEKGLPIEDKEQESRVLDGRSTLVADEDLLPFYREFLQHTMNVSKEWQAYLIGRERACCEVVGEEQPR